MKQCHDCRGPFQRSAPAIYCLPCAQTRHDRNQRTSALKYSRSPRGKIMKSLWTDAHRAQVNAGARRLYRSHHPIRIKKCQMVGCENTWKSVRPIQRRQICWKCAVAYYPPSQAKRRKDMPHLAA